MAMPAVDLYPWLVADIGGTNARFGLVRAAGASVSDVIALRVAEFATPEDAASKYLDQIAERDGARPRPGVADQSHVDDFPPGGAGSAWCAPCAAAE
jgi:glucokinase